MKANLEIVKMNVADIVTTSVVVPCNSDGSTPCDD